MSLLKPANAEELILHNLRRGEQKATELLAKIRRSRPITKQGFYAALRKLRAEENVTIYKGTVALNATWIRDMLTLLEEMRETYLPASDPTGVLALRERESISYVFANTKQLDVFWGHAQSVLVEQTPKSEPVYSYDPHYWFYIARKETEHKLVERIAASGRQFLMTVGGNTPLDKVLQKDFNSDLLQYHLQESFKKRNYYVVVIGDFITEVWLDPKTAEQIDAVYEGAVALNAGVGEDLKKYLTLRARNKIKITRNARKARAHKAKLGKNFFIKSYVN